jgi:hypothetical protein
MIPKIQKRFTEQVLEQQRPHPSGLLRTRGQIVQVYDAEYDGELPRRVSELRTQAPGELVYLVKLDNIEAPLPLLSGDSPDIVFLTFGNAPLLIGRRVVVEYETGMLERGRVFFEGKRQKKPEAVSKRINFPDIGSII